MKIKPTIGRPLLEEYLIYSLLNSYPPLIAFIREDHFLFMKIIKKITTTLLTLTLTIARLWINLLLEKLLNTLKNLPILMLINTPLTCQIFPRIIMKYMEIFLNTSPNLKPRRLMKMKNFRRDLPLLNTINLIEKSHLFFIKIRFFSNIK